MNATNSLLTTGSAAPRKIKVLIVEDSSIIRNLLTRWLGVETDIEVAGIAVNGREAVRLAGDLKPDVVVLDIEMPVMDGLTALPEILKCAPQSRVIMASTLTQRGGEITIRALSAGASDYLAKPDAGALAGAADYKRDLVTKIRMLGARALRGPTPPSTPSSATRPSMLTRPDDKAAYQKGDDLRPVTIGPRPKAIFIGSSTGGPEALKVVITGLKGKVDVPVLITQHMPPLFTKILADHLTKQTGASVIEAESGMIAQPGKFYIAPGNFHMTVSYAANVLRIELNQEDAENFCRPAVDPMFRSAAATLGDRALAVVLTGMGVDGRDGGKVMVGKGAMLIAQDEETSIVWGMPGAVVRAGLASVSKPLDEIAPGIISVMRGVVP
jgi:two-component system, chemotaxis family, protein-glutamate methylesterase/glutaminase